MRYVQAAVKREDEEQTASLQAALLHGHCGLVCGPRCEPLSRAPFLVAWTSTHRATKGWPSLPAAALTCHLRLLAPWPCMINRRVDEKRRIASSNGCVLAVASMMSFAVEVEGCGPVGRGPRGGRAGAH